MGNSNLQANQWELVNIQPVTVFRMDILYLNDECCTAVFPKPLRKCQQLNPWAFILPTQLSWQTIFCRTRNIITFRLLRGGSIISELRGYIHDKRAACAVTVYERQRQRTLNKKVCRLYAGSTKKILVEGCQQRAWTTLFSFLCQLLKLCLTFITVVYAYSNGTSFSEFTANHALLFKSQKV